MKYYVRSPNGEGTFGVMKVIDPHKPLQYVSLADDIEIQNAYRDIDNADVSFDVIIDDETIRLTFDDIDDITNVKGYALHSGNKNDVMNYLRQQYKELLKSGKVKHVYNDIGWNNGTFRGYSANTPKGTAYYNGIFDLKPHGTKAGFIDDLQKLIIGHTELELSVILGLSACTIGFLKTKDVVLDSLVVNIYGTSTTGKTTGAKLAISMGGSPQNTYKHSSLARTCSTTQNALIAQLRGNSGYPVLFDELGMLDKRVNIPQLVFDIATGSGKQRLNAACKFHFDKSWATTIIFTGEASLLEGQKVVDGINMRVLTFDNAKWTVSAKQAHKVEQFSKAYSGLPITLLAEFISSYKTKVILRAFAVLTASITKRLDIPCKYKERKAKSIAVLMLTALLSQRAFGVKLSLKDLENFIISNVNRTCCNEQWRIAYWDFVQYVAMNGGHFNKKVTDPFVKNGFQLHSNNGQHFISTEEVNAIGFLCYQERGKEKAYAVGITEVAFSKWFEDKGFKNKEETLRQWRDTLKVLLLPKGKEDRFKVNNIITEQGAEVPCYHILLINESDSENEENNSENDTKDCDSENQIIVV